MAKKIYEFKTVWYINVPDENGKAIPILVKDTDGKIKPEHEALVVEAAKRMKIRCAKSLASYRGFQIEIEE